MIKNDDLLALPRAAKPAKAMRAAQEHARPCTAPGVICAKVHETADGPVLALDCGRAAVCMHGNFLTGRGSGVCFFGRTAHQRQRAFSKRQDATPLHGHPGQTENAWRRFSIFPGESHGERRK
ncbi:MAG: hypothetical protein ACLVJ8_01100 [Ruthenibacterium lactatiformans]